MLVRHEIELPQLESFYTDELVFEVKVDGSACGTFTRLDQARTKFTLSSPTVLAPLLTPVNGTQHRTSLESVSSAALRFYRSGDVKTFAPAEYISVLFMTRYQWGLAFQKSAKTSLEHRPRGTRALHSEAVKTHTEHLAYGLAVHFVAKLLGIPIDRFFFLTAAGARADFRTRVSTAELSSAGGGSVGMLSAAGHIVGLEVKARTGWASHRCTSKDGIELLYNLSKKAAARPNDSFLSVIVAMPDKTPSPRTRTKLIIADPGEPVALHKNEQLLLLLEESLLLLVRHGLWPTLSSALTWIKELRGALTANEAELDEFIERHDGQRQYRLLTKEHSGRRYNGRIFSDMLLRLGRHDERGMSRVEAEQRLSNDDLGRAWYSGADWVWINAVQDRNAETLLTYGVRGVGELDLSAQSAFLLEEEPMTDDLRGAVRDSLRQALRRW